MNSIFFAVLKRKKKKKRMSKRLYLICSYCGEKYFESSKSTSLKLMNEKEYNKFLNKLWKKKLDFD